MNLLLLAHASPTARPLYERALEGLPEPWEIAPFIAPPLAGVPGGGLSSRYVALADRLEVSAAAPTPLEALLLRLGLAPRARWGRVVLASWSAGYALALRLLDEQGLDGWIALDSGYTDRDPDGTASDERLAPAVRLVADARAGRRLFWFGFTDIRTPYASTSEVAAELQRLGGPPEGLWHVERWPGGTARDHEDALRVDGPGFARRALEALLGAAPETLPTGRAPVEQEPPPSSLPPILVGRPTLRASLVRRFRAALAAGVREVGGPNRGPEVESYLRAAGLGPGQPWCCAMVCAEGRDAAGETGTAWPLPMTGRVALLVGRARVLRRWHPLGDGYEIRPGDLPIYGRGGQRPDQGGDGHVGVYVGGGKVISGNLHDRVTEHDLDPGGDLKLLGSISLE